jgi:hypothetical protein
LIVELSLRDLGTAKAPVRVAPRRSSTSQTGEYTTEPWAECSRISCQFSPAQPRAEVIRVKDAGDGAAQPEADLR